MWQTNMKKKTKGTAVRAEDRRRPLRGHQYLWLSLPEPAQV